MALDRQQYRGMSTGESSAPLDDIAALMRRFLSGDIEVDVIVRAIRASPSNLAGDFAFALDGMELSSTTEARLDALVAALSE